MARRRSSSSSRKSSQTPLYIILGVVAAILLIFVASKVLKPSQSKMGEPTTSFRISDYRNDGSRFVNNIYVLEGRVENIITRGNDRLLSVSLSNKENEQERLPLLLHEGVAKNINITRGDTYHFKVECRTGQDANGEQVKGVFIVREVAN